MSSVRLNELWERRAARHQADCAFGFPTVAFKKTWWEQHHYAEYAEPTIRIVGKVVPEMGRRGDWLVSIYDQHVGWFDNDEGDSWNDGSGLIWGVVGQLPARNGKTRFIAGWQVGGDDAGVFWDKSMVWQDENFAGVDRDFKNCSAARNCGRYADKLAEDAAESEREYRAKLKEEEEDDAA